MQEKTVKATQVTKLSLLVIFLLNSYRCCCITGVASLALLSPVIVLDYICATLKKILHKHINVANKLHKVGL